MMHSNALILCTALLVSISFWWGVNAVSENIETVFYEKMLGYEGAYLATAASINLQEALLNSLPAKKQAENPALSAEAAFSVFVHENGNRKVLFEKNSQIPLPIASIAKLMTLHVAETYLPLESVYETYPALLLASDNGAAEDIASRMGVHEFVQRMNEEATTLGFESMFFVNPSGLDAQEGHNLASAQDVALLLELVQQKHAGIFPLLAQYQYELSEEDHALFSTNQLLTDSDFPLRILGGKTGETSRAKQALVLMTNSPTETGYMVHVVLRSEDRFQDMKSLVRWVLDSYKWTL
ncbi:MAG: hypothetical protein Q8P39_02030 [Candidatus Yanofskybacteria bacterium]|nr:hypothetical protein [Candidatus Yanofskybacteria bacterium]